jgi:hypothetical protein
MVAPLLWCLLVSLPMSPRLASEVVVMRAPGGSTPAGFADALRIQLAGSATVIDGPEVTGTTASERLASANRALRGPTSLVVWVEGSAADDGATHYVLYVVGSKRGRALMEVFRLTGSGPEVDRALALKVHEVLDQVLAPPSTAADPAGWVRDREPPPPVRPPPPARPIRASGIVELGGLAISGSAGPQAGAVVGAGGALRRERLRGEVYAVAYIASGHDELAVPGRVETDELGVGGGARVVYQLGPLSAGGGLELVGRRIHAIGTTPFGARGERSRWIGAGIGFAEARLPVGDALELRGAVGAEIALRRQQFSVNEITLIDLGRVRPVARLSALLRIR